MHSQLRRLALLLLPGLILLNTAAAAAELEEGKPAPPLRAQLLGGGSFDSANQRGNVIVVNFWATWCKPCREEMPAIEAYYRAHRTEGLEVIAISIEESGDIDKVRTAMKNFSFPAALASSAQTQGYGRLWRIPITFVIDRRGVLRFDGSRLAKALDLHALEKIVTPLLREPRAGAPAQAALGRKNAIAGHGG